MISNTEWLVLSIMLAYTGIIIIGLNKYETKLKKKDQEIADYRRALYVARLSQKDPQILFVLDQQNKALQKQVFELKAKLAGDQSIQYEHSTYKSNTYESKDNVVLEQDPFKLAYGPNLGE